MSRRNAELALGLACLALAAAILFATREGRAAGARRASLLERLLGPCASLVASAQWVRADLALREGRFGVFCERAETALALAPADPQGWIYYAHTLFYDRGSPLREPSRELRENWARAGIELLTRAERECAEPAEIWVDEGLVLYGWSRLPDEERPWPGSARELAEQALEAFGRARALGLRRAALLEQALRERLQESGR